MRSPFYIFRKYQKESTVVLVGMAMFAFIILDAVSGMTTMPKWMWSALLAMLLAGVFWVFGNRADKAAGKDAKGKALEYSLAGALLGAAIGVALIMFNRTEAAVQSTAGKISDTELREMVTRRQKAIQFMDEAYRASAPPPVDQPMQQALWYQGLAKATFGFRTAQGDFPIRKEDVVFKYLLLQEAKEYDIRLSKDAVLSHLNDVCKGLTAEAYNRIRQKMGLSEDDLVEILGEELTAQLVYNLKVPQRLQVSPPLAYWRQYKKYNVSQKLELVEIPVGSFTDKVGKPKESDLRALFDKYKEVEPSPEWTDTPAFKLPERIQIAYITPKADVIRKEIIAKLEAETVPKLEREARLKLIADKVKEVEAKIKSGDIKKEDAEEALAEARQREMVRLLKNSEPNRLEYEIVKFYEENKGRQFRNPAYAKPFPKKKSGPALKRIGPVVAPRPKRAAKKTESKTPAGKKGAFRRRDLRYRAFAFAMASPFGWSSMLYQPKTGKTDAKTGKKEPVKKKAVSKKPPANPGSDPSPKGDEKKADDEIKMPEPPPLPVDPVTPFRPLDSLTRQVIREQLVDERLGKEVERRMSEAEAGMNRGRSEYLKAIDSGEEFDGAKVSSKLAEMARSLDLEYKVTDMVGALELSRNPEKYPMVDVTSTTVITSLDNQFFMQNRVRSPLRELFPPTSGRLSDRSHQLYRIIKTAKIGPHENPQFRRFLVGVSNTEVYYLWKTAHQDAKVPNFDDKGVREKVVEAWKQIEARKFAEKRAKELASEVKASTKPMDELFDGKTVTGEKSATRLTPTMTPPFSWETIRYENLRAPIPSRSIPRIAGIEMTQILGVEKAGEKFRDHIFNKMNDGDIDVVPNADKSSYYVVRVFDRNPTTAAGLLAAKKKMVKEDDLFTGGNPQTAPYFEVNSSNNQANMELRRKWREALFEKYEVKLNFSEDDR